MVRNFKICENIFPGFRPTWPPKFWIECISALFSDTETNEVFDSYKVKIVEYEYVEINNISCIFSKMAAKMAAES